MSNSLDGDVVAPLSVATDLTVTVDGVEVDVESTGERLLVRVHSLPDALRVVRKQPRELTDAFDAVTTAADLTVEARVRDRIVAVAGAGARPGAVSRYLGVDPVEIRIDGALGAVGAEASAGIGKLSQLGSSLV